MEKILDLITQNSKITGNGSGITLVAIYTKTELVLPFVKECLNQLIREKKIYCRKGINDHLFFSK